MARKRSENRLTGPQRQALKGMSKEEMLRLEAAASRRGAPTSLGRLQKTGARPVDAAAVKLIKRSN